MATFRIMPVEERDGEPVRVGRIANLAVCLVVAIIAACDSTGPSRLTAPTAARDLDSLVISAESLIVAGHGVYGSRVTMAGFAEIPASWGVSPSEVTVTTATGSRTWYATVIELVDSSADGVVTDSQAIVMLYSDVHLSTSVRGIAPNADVALTTADTVQPSLTSTGVTIAETGVTGSCRRVGGLHSAFAMEYGPANRTCRPADFTVTLHFTAAVTSGVDSALASVTITPQPVRGVRLPTG